MDTAGKRALYDNLNKNETLALAVNAAVRESRQDDWRGNQFKVKRVRNAIKAAVGTDSRARESFRLPIPVPDDQSKGMPPTIDIFRIAETIEQHVFSHWFRTKMNTERSQITVSGLPVQIIRKGIKNLHLGVYPPDGRVRVAAPRRIHDEAVRLAVISKLAWIKRQRKRFHAQARQANREYASRESHYFLGRRYLLKVVEQAGSPKCCGEGIKRLSFVSLQEPLGTGANTSCLTGIGRISRL